mgnify:CR=1 FL=1
MKNIINRKNLTRLAVAVAIWAIIALLMATGIMSRSLQSLAIKICYYVILTLSLDLIVGYLGDLSLGHAAFYAVGGYAGCAFAVYVNMPFLPKFILSLIIGGITAAIVGFLISKAILKLRGDYLAIVTLAFGEFIRSFVKIIPGLGGTKGLIGVPGYSNRIVGFSLSYIVVLLVIVAIYNFTRSRYGRAVTAIRDNSIAVASVGIDIRKMKVLVFTVASFMAGMAGVLFGFYKSTLNPSDFTYNLSIEVLVMVVLGGMGSIKGSVIASVVIVALPELLRGASDYRMLIYAIALIAMMMFKSNPTLARYTERLGASIDNLRKSLSKKSGGESK